MKLCPATARQPGLFADKDADRKRRKAGTRSKLRRNEKIWNSNHPMDNAFKEANVKDRPRPGLNPRA